MNISGNTILITGGATGIGFALAEAFVKNNNEVIVCARTDKNLQLAQQKIPQYTLKYAIYQKKKRSLRYISGQQRSFLLLIFLSIMQVYNE